MASFRRRAPARLARLLILALIVIWSGVPILLVLVSSFKDPRAIFEYPPRLLFSPNLRNYAALARDWPEFFRTLGNSAVITLGAAVLTVAISFLGGYAYSRARGRVLAASAFSLMFIRMLPPIVITIPLYPIIRALGLFDSHLTLILFYSAFFVSLGTWLMKSFIDQIPIELEEAAIIDGASRAQVLGRIALPLSAHGMMATSTFVIIFAWKEFLFAFLFTTSRAKTAPLIISEMLASVTGVLWGPLFAAATLQLLPILAFVWLVQGVLVEGMTVGSVKG